MVATFHYARDGANEEKTSLHYAGEAASCLPRFDHRFRCAWFVSVTLLPSIPSVYPRKVIGKITMKIIMAAVIRRVE